MEVSSTEKIEDYTTVYPACTICNENDIKEICIGTKKQMQSQRNAIEIVNLEFACSEKQKTDHKKDKPILIFTR